MMRVWSKMDFFKCQILILLSVSSHLTLGSSVTTPVQNQTREGRGILDTIQSVVQTVQTVNKLFNSGGNSNQNNNNNNYYNNAGAGYGPGQGNYQQYQSQPQSQIITNQQYGTVPQPQYQSPTQNIYNPIQSQAQNVIPQNQNYQSFPVSASLNYNDNSAGHHPGFHPGTVSNVNLPQNPVSVNKQGVGSSNLLSTVGDLGIIEDLTDLFSFTNVEKVLNNVNKFDSLQCIPRIVCQTIAKRQQETAENEKTSTTTTTRRPKSRGNKKNRNGRFIPGFKIQGVDTALEQFVKFLDLMKLNEWSVYPYLKGAYQGNQVKSSDECAEKFSTCPFSEDQLLYYFNNYKGGLFQSFRSDLNV